MATVIQKLQDQVAEAQRAVDKAIEEQATQEKSSNEDEEEEEEEEEGAEEGEEDGQEEDGKGGLGCSLAFYCSLTFPWCAAIAATRFDEASGVCSMMELALLQNGGGQHVRRTRLRSGKGPKGYQRASTAPAAAAAAAATAVFTAWSQGEFYKDCHKSLMFNDPQDCQKISMSND
eukprot:1137433-Pelagomonas_calceolata.AAC.6